MHIIDKFNMIMLLIVVAWVMVAFTEYRGQVGTLRGCVEYADSAGEHWECLRAAALRKADNW